LKEPNEAFFHYTYSVQKWNQIGGKFDTNGKNYSSIKKCNGLYFWWKCVYL